MYMACEVTVALNDFHGTNTMLPLIPLHSLLGLVQIC